MQPLVSIVIPCYNARRWVGEAIQSCLDQTYSPVEIIVIDDGSTDGSLEVIKSFGDKIHWETGPNLGGNRARNIGIDLSKGDYIQFLDADDLLDPRKIEIQAGRLTREPPKTVAMGAWGTFVDLPSKAAFNKVAIWNDATPVEWLITSWAGESMMPPQCWLTPRAMIMAAGKWNEQLKRGQDGEYFTRVLLGAGKLAFCPAARAFYRQGNPQSITKNMSPEFWQSAFQSVSLCVHHLLNFENSPRTRQAAADYLQRFAFTVYAYSPALAAMAGGQAMKLGGTKIKFTDRGGRAALLASVFGWKMAAIMVKQKADIFRWLAIRSQWSQNEWKQEAA